MNSLYTLGVRQTNSIQADLERLRNGDNSASLLGLLDYNSSEGMVVEGYPWSCLTLVRAGISVFGCYGPYGGRL